jgi:hypothetical protein
MSLSFKVTLIKAHNEFSRILIERHSLTCHGVRANLPYRRGGVAAQLPDGEPHYPLFIVPSSP